MFVLQRQRRPDELNSGANDFVEYKRARRQFGGNRRIARQLGESEGNLEGDRQQGEESNLEGASSTSDSETVSESEFLGREQIEL